MFSSLVLTIPSYSSAVHNPIRTPTQQKSFLITYLEEYKRDPSQASLYLAITLYDELASKGIVLVRGDICAPASLSVEDSRRTVAVLLHMYLQDPLYTHIHSFNHMPDQVDFNALLETFSQIPTPDIHALSDVGTTV
uniref:30S ribosomal protein S20 n=1 Tax=Lygus hesperus TaxID=30085 RepID=A0A0A9XSU6_LYGHE